MKRFPLVLALILVVVLLNIYIKQQQDVDSPEPRYIEGLPWQIDIMPNGKSSVFGVTLDESSLADATRVLGPDFELAVVDVPDEPLSLEIYYHRYTAAIFTGKLLLVGDIETEVLQDFIGRAIKVKQLQTGARLITLDSADRERALQAIVKTLTFVPSIHLEKEIALERFGQPDEIIVTGDNGEHLLYPHKGLDLLIDEDGKEILQYVAPGDFNLVREPLIQNK